MREDIYGWVREQWLNKIKWRAAEHFLTVCHGICLLAKRHHDNRYQPGERTHPREMEGGGEWCREGEEQESGDKTEKRKE